MGLHIMVYRMTGPEETIKETFGASYYTPVREQSWFDSGRYSGDEEFWIENEFRHIGNDREYVRPINFTKCREWLSKKNDFMKERLGALIDRMEADPMLVIYFSI